MNDQRKHTIRCALLRLAAVWTAVGAALALPTGQAVAQEWPTKTVRIIVPAPGGASDALARILAPRLEAIWKQPVIVENKPGAGGVIGTEYVVASTDGHTLLMGTQSSLIPKYTQKSLRYDPLTDIVPVYKLINYQMVIATNAQTAGSGKTLADVVALSKADDKGLFFAGFGATGVFNLSMALLNQSMGIRYSTIDFNNIGALTLALLRNDTQLSLNTTSAFKQHIDAGTVKALAVASHERYASLPDVPTIYEAVNYKGYLPVMWSGIFVPKGTPTRVIDRIGRDLLALAVEPAVKKQIESAISGSVPRSSPDTFAKEFREEADIWKGLIPTLNIKPE